MIQYYTLQPTETDIENLNLRNLYLDYIDSQTNLGIVNKESILRNPNHLIASFLFDLASTVRNHPEQSEHSREITLKTAIYFFDQGNYLAAFACLNFGECIYSGSIELLKQIIEQFSKTTGKATAQHYIEDMLDLVYRGLGPDSKLYVEGEDNGLSEMIIFNVDLYLNETDGCTLEEFYNSYILIQSLFNFFRRTHFYNILNDLLKRDDEVSFKIQELISRFLTLCLVFKDEIEKYMYFNDDNVQDIIFNKDHPYTGKPHDYIKNFAEYFYIKPRKIKQILTTSQKLKES